MEKKQILAIDAGTRQSAYVIADIDTLKPLSFDIVDNETLIRHLYEMKHTGFYGVTAVALELFSNRGMPVGKETFQTCYFIGQVMEVCRQADCEYIAVYRNDEKMAICGTMKAKDGNIRQALIDEFGIVGTKKNRGWFYGFKKDIWQAYAVGYVAREKINGRF